MSTVRAIWQLPPAPGAPRRVWRDWALVGVLGAVALLEAFLRPGLPWLWPSVAVELGLIATLLWRRTHPGLMVGIALGVSLVMNGARWIADVAPTELYTTAFVLILLYALPRWGSGRDLVLGGGAVVIGIAGSLAVGPADAENIVGGVAVVTVALTLGVVFRVRARLREQRMEQARLAERGRLARELHDTVAHHVSAIAIRAQAGLATADRDPAAAAEALRVIEAEASRTLGEMRSLVRVLRSEDDPLLSPLHGAVDLQELASERDVPPVTLRIDGDLASLPETVAAALYRIAQESITNARRHAVGATAIEVDVRVTPQQASIRIHDDGRPSRGDTSEGGYGIVGMRERASLLGGELQAGADAAAGWTVAATIPLEAGAR